MRADSLVITSVGVWGQELECIKLTSIYSMFDRTNNHGFITTYVITMEFF